METINAPVQQAQAPNPVTRPACPVCDGQLILLRGFYRCTRCGCNFCESCEGPSSAEE